MRKGKKVKCEKQKEICYLGQVWTQSIHITIAYSMLRKQVPHQRQLLETKQHKQIAVQDTIATLTETNQLELNPVRILLKDEDDLNDNGHSDEYDDGDDLDGILDGDDNGDFDNDGNDNDYSDNGDDSDYSDNGNNGSEDPVDPKEPNDNNDGDNYDDNNHDNNNYDDCNLGDYNLYYNHYEYDGSHDD